MKDFVKLGRGALGGMVEDHAREPNPLVPASRPVGVLYRTVPPSAISTALLPT